LDGFVERRLGPTAQVGSHEWTLTKLALNDDVLIANLTESDAANLEASGLDPRAHALVRIGALLALDAAPASYASVVRLAERAGVSASEVVGVLVAVAPYIGIARTVSAAPELALAVGFDVDDVIERDRDSSGRA
jgi:alkylhydroperoxidase/carboxymuconolactone decarboxylase family protein YurZ